MNNDGWCFVLRSDPRTDGQPAYATGTTYQLNARQTGYPSNFTTGTFNPPFVIHVPKDKSTVDLLGQTTRETLSDPRYTRTLSAIHSPSRLVLLGEASSYFWLTQTPQTVNGITHYAPRIAARHGARVLNGTNAMTNLAFFDGHCETRPTLAIDQNDGTGPGVPSGCSGLSAMTSSSGMAFSLFMNRYR
ncbi:MAG: hypothetical protein QM754_16110 [Tepidisphaeraceae bacterium]